MAGASVVFDLIARDRASSAFNNVANSADRSTSTFGKLGATFRTVAKAGALAAAAGGVVAVKFGIDAIGAASDLNETLNKTSVVFGKNAAAVVEWSKSSATSLGLSQQAALAFTSQFGDMFIQLGATTGEAAKTSKGIVKLATDLGSFHNLETAEVLDKISGAMRGEYDAIQKIIPGLSDARVKQEALRASGKDSVDTLTEQEKAMAALRIITKDGAAANNDFAETSDGLANQQKILKSQFENVKAELGQGLLPIATGVVSWINDTGIPGFQALGDEVQKIFSGGGGGAGDGVMGALIEGAQDAWGGLKVIWGGIQDGWESLTKKVGDSLREHGPMIDRLAEGFVIVSEAVWNALGPAISWLAETALSNLGQNFANVMDGIKLGGNVFFDLSDAVLSASSYIVNTVASMADSVLGGFQAMAEGAAQSAAALGLPTDAAVDAVNSIVGIRKGIDDFASGFDRASNHIRAGLEEQQWAWNLTEREAAKLSNRIRLLPDEVSTEIKTPGAVDSLRDVRRLKRQYDLSPDEVITTIEASGVPLTLKDVRRLQRQYDLTPKQVGTLVKQTGASTTIKDLKAVLKQAEITGKKEVNTVLKAIGVDVTARDLKMIENEGIKLGKLNIKPKLEALGAPAANAAINGVRANLTSLDSPSNDVHNYIYTHRVGGGGGGRNDETVLGGGLSAIQKILASLDGGLPGVQTALSKITDHIKKQIDLKDAKKEAAREKAVLKALKDEYAALVRNGKQQDANNRKLEQARQHLEKVRGWVNQIKQSFIDIGNVTSLGIVTDEVTGNASVSSSLLIQQLQGQVNKAKEFARIIRELSDGKGVDLNKTSLEQLLAAGPEAGFEAAAAFSAMTDAEIQAINAAAAELASVGNSLGRDVSSEFFKGGIEQAEGFVSQLEKEQKRLDAVARRMGRKLAEAMRKAMGGGGGDDDDDKKREGIDTSPRTTRGLTGGVSTRRSSAGMSSGGDTYVININTLDQRGVGEQVEQALIKLNRDRGRPLRFQVAPS